MAKFTRLNDNIRASQLRVIDDSGSQLGVMSRAEALALARDKELDLVEIAPDASPAVAKIVDWGKYNYQKTKQQQKNRRNAKVAELKQMRLGLKISVHDRDVKLNKVKKFLEAGHKVKITLFFRGREMAHKDLGFQMADDIIASFEDTIVVDQKPQLSGKQLSFVIRSSNHAKAKNS